MTSRADELVERYYPEVYNLAYRALGCREDAEDVAQQTFAQALPRLAELQQPSAARGWLLRIALNAALDELRRRSRRAKTSQDCTPDWDGLPDADRLIAPVGALELHELRVDVWRAALTLPPQQRLALALREMHHMTYAEIANVLQSSVAAIETLLFRARQSFRRAYVAGTSPSQTDAACRAMLVQLSASIDGELCADEQRLLDRHLRGCPTCQIAARELRPTARQQPQADALVASSGMHRRY
jgi:RNA polymerase sigma-70 factor, ECF subfamily